MCIGSKYPLTQTIFSCVSGFDSGVVSGICYSCCTGFTSVLVSVLGSGSGCAFSRDCDWPMFFCICLYRGKKWLNKTNLSKKQMEKGI
jgi:hypothetical protein